VTADIPGLAEVARAATSVGDVQSAVIFVVDPEGENLRLAAASGIDGSPLDGLVAAVANPAHPVARAVRDDGPTFDVLPMNPGGPKLRSHLPLRVSNRTVGVLAVAHDAPVDDEERAQLIGLAEEAATAIGD
jgi:GAF domain-containing protein